MSIIIVSLGLFSLLVSLFNIRYINKNFNKILSPAFIHLLIVYHLISIVLDGYINMTTGVPIMITGLTLLFAVGMTFTSIYAKLNYPLR